MSVGSNPTPVPTKDRKKFEEVLKNKGTPEEKEQLPSIAEQRILAENMALTIDSVCTEICDILNKKDESELIAIFLHASILDWLFHKRVIHTYETQGNPLDILKNQLVSKFNTSTADNDAAEILNNNSGKKSAQQILSEKINNALANMNPELEPPIAVLKKMLYKNPVYHFGKRENLSTKVKRRNRTNFGTKERGALSPTRDQVDAPDSPSSMRRVSDMQRVSDMLHPYYIQKIMRAMSVSMLGARTSLGRVGIINLLADVTYGSVLELLDTMHPSEVHSSAEGAVVHPRLVASMFILLEKNKIKNVFQLGGVQNLIYIAYIYSMVVYTAYKRAYNFTDEYDGPYQTMFGKKKPKVKKLQKVKKLPNKSIMTKLKSVGIKITRKRGKRRVYLSRPELIKKATAFRNLQLRAKKLKVRIMYKNKKGKYVYKKAKRLHSDIKRQISKMKKPAKKPAKKSNTKKQIKQRFG